MKKNKTNPIESPQNWTKNTEGYYEFMGSWIDNKTFAKLVMFDLEYIHQFQSSNIINEIVELKYGSSLNEIEYADAYNDLVQEMEFDLGRYDHLWINELTPQEYFLAIFQKNPKYINFLKRAVEIFFKKNYYPVSIPHAKSFSYLNTESKPIHSIEETNSSLYNPNEYLDHPIHQVDHTDRDNLSSIGFRLCRTTRKK